MNEFSVRKLSEVVYGDEGVVSKYRMLRPHSGTDRPFNLFAVRTSHTPSVQPSGMEAAAPNCRTRRPSIIATPPSTNSSIPVIRRMRETHGLGDLIGYAEPAERNSIGNQVLCCSPTSEEGSRYSIQVCRWSLGSSRSRECGVLLNQLSMSARTNAHTSRLLRSGSGGRQALRL